MMTNRARIFAPFDALRGLREALAAKEHIVVPKADLTDDKAAELDWTLQELHPGDMVAVTYYAQGEYVKKSGILARLDIPARCLKIVKTKIRLDDIHDIECLIHHQWQD